MAAFLRTAVTMRLALSMAAVCFLAACPPTTPDGFDDHTVPSLATQADFERFAVGDNGRLAVKFVITGFGTNASAVRWSDSHFYSLHDEWYWFRLLNGQSIPSREGIAPVEGLEFATVQDIYAWAKDQLVLPLDLRFIEERLYSPRFYSLALDLRPRALGLGTLIHVAPQAARPERWAFQLEYIDIPTHEELVHFFEQIDATMPEEVRGQAKWLVRSPKQEELAQLMEQQGLRFHDRILRQKDLATDGELEVYNGGLTAGRIRIVRAGETLTDARGDELLVLEDVPDVLPPAAGVITAVPQTPLAHINLLAKNRGIPNAYLGGAVNDPILLEYARLGTPVVVNAKVPDELVIKAITADQLATWQQLKGKTPVSVMQVDVASLPYSVDLRTLDFTDADTVRPSLGGKATGYLALLDATPDATPQEIEGISIRSYVEHLAPFRARLEAMLAHAEFQADARVRFLVLEGESAFKDRYPTDEAFLASFLAAHGPGDGLGDFARAGGVKGSIRSAAITPATLGILTDTLTARFGSYAVTQGLRFRSSSTAEDVEGFNGAGLYDSSTGFLDAAAQPTSGDRKQTVEWALKKTWASYWGFEAFEERRLEKVEHLSGNMGVVVHARFDDAREVSNGVFLFTVANGALVMDLNVQAGALSVTNPTSTELPEIDRVSLAVGATTPSIERLRASTVAPAGTQLLTDAQLLETFERARLVATRWLEGENAARPAAQRSRSVVLDFEFRHVSEGWPALKTGVLPSRIVLKQVRSLEPGLRDVPASVIDLPLPRDVLRRARRIEKKTCDAALFRAVVVEALTDPAIAPDLGHATLPFTASVSVQFKAASGSLNVSAGEVVSAEHVALTQVTHRELPARWSLEASLTGQKLSSLELRSGRFVFRGTGSVEGADVTCTTEVLRSTPSEYLLSLL